MRRVRAVLAGLGRFVWDLLVGDDWRIAAAITTILVLGALTAGSGAVPEALLAPLLGAALVVVTLTTLLVSSRPDRGR